MVRKSNYVQLYITPEAQLKILGTLLVSHEVGRDYVEYVRRDAPPKQSDIVEFGGSATGQDGVY